MYNIHICFRTNFTLKIISLILFLRYICIFLDSRNLKSKVITIIIKSKFVINVQLNNIK